MCPNVSGTPCSTLSTLPATSGSSIPVTVTRTTATYSSAPTGTGKGNGTNTVGSTGSPSPTLSVGGARAVNANIGCTFWGVFVALMLL